MSFCGLIIRVAGYLACLLAITSCATTINHGTESGKPEVTVDGVPYDKTKSAFIEAMIERGYNLMDDSSHRLVFEKEESSLGASLAYGSQFDHTPAWRVSYTLLRKSDDATRVIADCRIVTNEGSGFEKTTDLSKDKSSVDLFRMMQELEASLEGRSSDSEG